MMFSERTVIVIDAGNYKDPEPTPFKALVDTVYEHEIWVTSLATGRAYELYYDQIFETLEIEHISRMLNMDQYSKI